MTAASLDEEEDMDLSEEGEVGTAREGDDDPKEGDEDLQPPGEDPGAKQSNGGGGKKRKKRTSGQVRDDGEELAQKAQVFFVHYVVQLYIRVFQKNTFSKKIKTEPTTHQPGG